VRANDVGGGREGIGGGCYGGRGTRFGRLGGHACGRVVTMTLRVADGDVEVEARSGWR